MSISTTDLPDRAHNVAFREGIIIDLATYFWEDQRHDHPDLDREGLYIKCQKEAEADIDRLIASERKRVIKEIEGKLDAYTAKHDQFWVEEVKSILSEQEGK